MHEREMQYKLKNKLRSEESHPVTGRLEENRRNRLKKQEKSVLKANQIQQ